MSRTTSKPVLALDTENQRAAVCEDVVVAALLAVPDVAAVQNLVQLLNQQARSHARTVLLLRLFEGCELSGGVQAAVMNAMKHNFRYSHGWAISLEGSGAWASRLRTQFTRMHTGAGVRLRTRLFTNVDSAAKWASQLSTRADSLQAIIDASRLVAERELTL